MNVLIDFLTVSNINPHELSLRESSSGLPDDTISCIFNLLTPHEITSSRLAEVSYQFYSVSKPVRDQFNNELKRIYEQISKVAIDSFHTKSSPSLCCHFDFMTEQRFYININYLIDQKTNLTKIECEINKEVSDDEGSYGSKFDKSKLNYSFIIVDEIKRRKSFFWTTTQSSKVKLLVDSHLKPELQSMASRAIEKINKNR